MTLLTFGARRRGGGASPAAGLHPSKTITAVRSYATARTDEYSMTENIIKVDATYWLLYTSSPGDSTYIRLHLASSSTPEGPWTAYAGNPILTTVGPTALAWESVYTNGASILEHQGTFYLFYCDEGTQGAIGLATAPAVTGPYTKRADPILPVASGWESRRVQEPHVAQAPDGSWVMAYMAEDMAGPQGTTEQCGIATAPTLEGPWTRSPNNPVLPYGPDGAWDEGGTADPSLFYENGFWWMLYSGLSGPSGGQPWRLGLAYATDVHGPWTRIATNPILSNTDAGTFDSKSVWRGAIFKEGGVYYLPYGGIPSNGSALQAHAGAARLVIT